MYSSRSFSFTTGCSLRVFMAEYNSSPATESAESDNNTDTQSETNNNIDQLRLPRPEDDDDDDDEAAVARRRAETIAGILLQTKGKQCAKSSK